MQLLEAAALRNLRMRGFHFQQGVEQRDCLPIANSLGVPLGDARNPELLRFISPQPTRKAKPNTLSSRYGMEAFPFHTDAAYWATPPRFILLHCVSPGAGSRPTLLIDPREWTLPELEKRMLCNEVWRVTTRRPFLCTAGTQAEEGLCLRFDEACMAPLTAGANTTRDVVRARIGQSNVVAINWHVDDLLIIDNLRLLHARGKAIQTDEDRILARILIRG
jgi:L-asparagine oxygenase